VNDIAKRAIASAGAAVRRLNPHLFPGTGPSPGAQRLRSDEPQPGSGRALVVHASGEASGRKVPAGRYRIRFIVYAVRPCDWDNYRTKAAQDCLVAAGFLPADDWKTLEGEVVTRKAKTKIEERTVIEIWKLA
jgi:hypothetical protein